MNLIKAQGLTLKLGSKYLLKDINMEIKSGENWVLFGLNGCGKTTLLSVLTAYQNAAQGSLELFGEPVDDENRNDLMPKMGFVSSSFFNHYFRHKIILDIILSGKYATLGLQDDVTDADVRKAKSLLRLFGIEKKSRYPYDMLSKGQQQLVLIARALMGNPKILILDEPCSGLDIISRERFLQLIERLAQKQNLTVLYVTHHTEEILPYFNKAALMKDGSIAVQGDIKDVFSDETLSKFLDADAQCIWTERHLFVNINDLNMETTFEKRWNINET